MVPSQRPSQHSASFKLDWGCEIPLDPQNGLPASATLNHNKAMCHCYFKGGDTQIVRHYLYEFVYEKYYRQNPEQYDAFTCNLMAEAQAERIGLRLGGDKIWYHYPDCLPQAMSRVVGDATR
ncbi:hypothetical protein NUW58_g1285 [Xylaria curta]|uniref:Uncharacterized protein n=1 Tax=Xylaria curta TaxID=42375 RepID=A0ACC1PMN7_9PEZI|nr:hypothetical protein NUW58_g1285 [Xylaria curta]